MRELNECEIDTAQWRRERQAERARATRVTRPLLVGLLAVMLIILALSEVIHAMSGQLKLLAGALGLLAIAVTAFGEWRYWKVSAHRRSD